MIRVEMLATGDEVLHGQIVDTNAAWLAGVLFENGLPMTSRQTTGDNLDELVNVLTERSKVADVLIVNGGQSGGRETGDASGMAGEDGSLFCRAGPENGRQQPQAGRNTGRGRDAG